MRTTTTFLALSLMAIWCLGGCSSDSTAPDDSLPRPTNETVAGQAGFMAVAMVQIAPLALEYDGTKAADEGQYTYTFEPGDPVQGTVNLQFRLGGATGDLCPYGIADWARASTPANEPLTVQLIEGGVAWELTFNLTSDLDRTATPATAEVNGSGVLVIGSYTANWTVDALVVMGSVAGGGTTWPASGTLTFTNSGIVAVVTFDGDHTATVEVGGVVYTLNLENGSLEPAAG